MNNHLLRLSRFGLIALFSLTTAVYSTAAEKSKPAGASANFELSWSRPATPTVQSLSARLKQVEERFKMGAAQKEEVDAVRFSLEESERHTPLALTIQSRGGLLKEFIATMSASEAVSMTVINAGEPADLETPLPPFNLRNANWGTVIEVMANFLATRGLQLKLAGAENSDLLASNSVVCVLRRVEMAAPPKGIEPTQFESFPVGQYLSEQSIDDIVSAIRAGWELDPTHDKDALKLKFHQPTSILLVSGPPEATHIAGKIISQLKGALDKDSKSALKSLQKQPPPSEAKK